MASASESSNTKNAQHLGTSWATSRCNLLLFHGKQVRRGQCFCFGRSEHWPADSKDLADGEGPFSLKVS